MGSSPIFVDSSTSLSSRECYSDKNESEILGYMIMETLESQRAQKEISSQLEMMDPHCQLNLSNHHPKTAELRKRWKAVRCQNPQKRKIPQNQYVKKQHIYLTPQPQGKQRRSR
ncbi:hypothetical protein PIB30_043590 [Stylosanthes scabra]|uniref:Uncharacterized protein n=1 Tax=Stylosanthes scabra TaxID=79078 RepID=A0ABU6SFH1_9FABA|nr:hypothetical protein [Stylosanthes scabra]